MDIKRYIFYFSFPIDHPKFYQHVELNHSDSPIYDAMIKYGVLATFFPQTYLFLEFIHLLVSTMYPHKCFVINRLGESVFQVSSLLIQQEFRYPSVEFYFSFSKESLITYFEELSKLECVVIYLYLLTNGK